MITGIGFVFGLFLVASISNSVLGLPLFLKINEKQYFERSAFLYLSTQY